jgi:hypothetical protein
MCQFAKFCAMSFLSAGFIFSGLGMENLLLTVKFDKLLRFCQK